MFSSCSDGSNDAGTIFYTASVTGSATTLSEQNGSATVSVALDIPNEGEDILFELMFSGTASLDEDYSVGSGSNRIPSGRESASFSLTTIDDSEKEGDETLTLTISFPNHDNISLANNGVVSLTITDDDASMATCSETKDSYTIDLEASGCKESAESDLGVASEYVVTESGNTKTIVSNGIPDHPIGMFPNQGNPNSIAIQNKTFTISANPSKSNTPTSLTTSKGQPRYWFGILDNSVILAPIAAEFFTNTSTGQDNTDWNESALSSHIKLGTDCNNAHVFPSGRYHHHATPSAYIADRNISTTSTRQVGWAADGFPIYYKYGNKDGFVVELVSGYRLKTTERGGDGISAPSGCPDGTYTQDYEYLEELGDLDECNGYNDPVLGYIYVITDTYPSIPRCFFGTPSEDFSNN